MNLEKSNQNTSNQYNYGDQPLDNVYTYQEHKAPQRRRWKRVIIAIIISGVILSIGVVALIIAIVRPLMQTYNISDKQLVIEAASDILDVDMEKMDKEFTQGLINKHADKCYFGTNSDDDLAIMVVWVQFDDAEEAQNYFNYTADDLLDELEDNKEDEIVNNYSWSLINSKLELAYIDEELSEEENEDIKVRYFMFIDDNYVLGLTIGGEKKEVDELYKDFLKELK